MKTFAGVEGRQNAATDDARDATAVGISRDAADLSPRPDAGRREVDTNVDHVEEALERELRRARDERRWVDADEIAQEIDARRVTSAVNLFDLEKARRRWRPAT